MQQSRVESSRRRSILPIVGAVLIVSAIAACSVEDVVAIRLPSPPSDASVVDPVTNCPGPVLLPGSTTCSGSFAASRFARGVCSCFDVTYANAGLAIDAFDSRVGAYSATDANPGGTLASNAPTAITGDSRVTGDVTIVTAAGLGIGDATRFDVGGTLVVWASLAGSSDTTSSVSVGDDAWVAASLVLASLTVGGDLHHPSTEFRDVSMLSVQGAIVDDEMPPSYPCDCGVAADLDVASIVTSASTTNENAALGLGAADLASLGADRTIALPCGRYYLTGIHGNAGTSLTIRATGHVALFVDGTIDVPRLVVTTDPGASLDLFVTGDLAFAPSWQLGDPAVPSALRIYTDGAAPIDLGNGIAFAGGLFAEEASLAASAPIVHYGAIVVDGFDIAQHLTVHEDRAIAAAGTGCPAP